MWRKRGSTAGLSTGDRESRVPDSLSIIQRKENTACEYIRKLQIRADDAPEELPLF